MVSRKVAKFQSFKDENCLTHFAQDRSCRDIRFYKIYLNSMLLLCDDIQELSERVAEETYLRETSPFHLTLFSRLADVYRYDTIYQICLS